MSWLRLWFTFESRVGRREYVVSGIALALIKYLGDASMVWWATGQRWTPLDYLGPVHALISSRMPTAPPSLLPVLAAWALPFLWVGVSMSMRRSLDAGLSAWLAMLFFVPGLSYLYIVAMCLLPSRERRLAGRELPKEADTRLPGALLSIAAGIAIGLGMLVVGVYGFRSYGLSLFLGTPFVVGAVTAFLFNRRFPATSRETQEVAAITLVCVGGIALLTAAEGAVCLVMALPLGLGVGAMGAALGRRIAQRDGGSVLNAFLAVIVLPVTAAMESTHAPTALREVRSAVVIDAPAAVVWRNVVAFPPLPEPSDLVFRAGIAYPERAYIEGSGVGAIRYCVFSTGAFVEPITRWEEGRRLSFDVRSQPSPMREWSPYANVAPPHLDGYFISRRGEFRLVALADGRTRLEGSTWYEMRLYPEAYWVLFGDALIGRIHARVLQHIKATAEHSIAVPQ